jgi:hypothetical protein
VEGILTEGKDPANSSTDSFELAPDLLHTRPWSSRKFDGDRGHKPMIGSPVDAIGWGRNPAAKEYQFSVNPSALGFSWVIH